MDRASKWQGILQLLPVPFCEIGLNYVPVACIFEICCDEVKTALDPDAMLNWPKEINKQVTI